MPFTQPSPTLYITANLSSLSGADDAASIVFTLTGYGNDMPRKTGAMISTASIVAQADDTGHVSQLIIGNDVITPAGTTYTVEILSDTGSYIAVGRYSLTGFGTVDLSTLTPIEAQGIIATGGGDSGPSVGGTPGTVTEIDGVNTVTYSSIFTAPPLGSANDSAAIYIKPSILTSADNKYGLFIEIPATQLDTIGGAIKVNHGGAGDGIYVAASGAGGTSYESASFVDGTKGIISTIQPGYTPFYTTLFNALWATSSVPGYGMFYADAAVGNAFVAHQLAGLTDVNQPMFSVVDPDLVYLGGIDCFGNYLSGTTGPALAGKVRLANSDTINWRNAANTADIVLGAPIQVDIAPRSTAITTTTLVTPAVSGFYRISASIKLTNAGTSPVAGPITIGWTDGDGSVAQSSVMALVNPAGAIVTKTPASGTTTTGTLNGSMTCYALGGVAISYAIAVSGTYGTGLYAAHVRVEAL